MPDLQGLVSFTGVDQIILAHCVSKPGIHPSLATLDVAPQAGRFYSGGTLELTFGANRIRWTDCQVERVTFQNSEQGLVYRLHILDRRWRWAFGKISGSYNLRRDDGTLVPGTERTPQQLAQLCLDALGETGGDLSSLPATLRPTVEWDYDNPAQALEALAAQCGCVIVLGNDDEAALAPIDAGRPLDLTDVTMRYGLTGVNPAAPAQFTVASGRMRIQADLPLQAVGLDVNGEIRALGDLSYAPPGGWSNVDLEHFQSIGNLNARELAKATVFRWYRIGAGFDLPVAGRINDLSLILPIEAEQVETTMTADGTARNRPAVVFGVWCDYASQATNRISLLAPLPAMSSVTDPRSIVSTRFSIDRERGLVKFAAPVIQYLEGPQPAAAQLVLRTAVGFRDPVTLAWKRLERSRGTGSAGTTVQYIDRGDLIPTAIGQYDPYSYALIGSITNFDAINAQADAALAVAVGQCFNRQPQMMLFAGLLPFQPDGAIDAVIWRIGPQGTTTEVLRHEKRPIYQFRPAPAPDADHRSRTDTQRSKRDMKHQPVT